MKNGFIGRIFGGVNEKSPLMVIFSVFFTILLYHLFGGSRCVAVQERKYSNNLFFRSIYIIFAHKLYE